jgi:hypothetical protein
MALVAVLTPFAILPAYAQAPSGSPAASPAAPPAASGPLSDQKLDAAAAAIARVAFLRQNYERQLAQADPVDRPKIEQQASGALTQAVKDQGLSVDEYNAIIQRAQQDPGVRQKLLDRLEPSDTPSPPPGE